MPGTFVRRATLPFCVAEAGLLGVTRQTWYGDDARDMSTAQEATAMCCLGRFVRETHTDVVPLFAWRAWGSVVAGRDEWTYPLLVRVLTALGALGTANQAGAPQVSARDRLFQGYLVSLNGTPWFPNRAFRAACGKRPAPPALPLAFGPDSHAIPSPDCTCGVYAVRRREYLSEIVSAGYENLTLIIGQVALWGWVLEYEHGCRAEFAYPAGLVMPNEVDQGLRTSLRQSARLYGVPVIGAAEGERGDALVPALR